MEEYLDLISRLTMDNFYQKNPKSSINALFNIYHKLAYFEEKFVASDSREKILELNKLIDDLR